MRTIKYTIGLLLTVLLICISADTSAQEQGAVIEQAKEEIVKEKREARKADRSEWRAYVEQVKADTNLTDAEREELLDAKRAEIKGKKREERDARRAASKAKVNAIEEDPNLSEEEKELRIKEIREASKADRDAKRVSKGQGKKKGKGIGDKAEAKEKRSEIKSSVKVIEEDPNLSEAEKEVRIKEIRDKAKAERDAQGGAKVKRDNLKKVERAISKGKLERATKGLDKAESRLEKAWKKGKITEDIYNERLAKINEVRAQIEE